MRWIPGAICAVLLATAGGPPAAAYQREIHDQALAIMAKLGQTDRKSVAVVDFTDLQGNVTELGRFLAEELSVRLSELGQEPRIAVVDRTHLKAILAEHKLSASGLMDPQAARRVAAVAGVDALVTGTVTPLAANVRLTVKVLDVGTAKIVAATSTDVPKTDEIKELLGVRIEGTAVAGSPSPAPSGRTQGAPGAEQVVEVGNVRIQLQGCRVSGGEVACALLVTSLQQDQTVTVERARAFDKAGNEYRTSRLQLGSNDGRTYVIANLITGVPVRASVEFQGFPVEAREVAVLEFSLTRKTVQFRDVPLGR